MVQVPKALAPEPYKSPIDPYGSVPGPLSASQKDAIQPTGPTQTRSPAMPIPDNTPLRVGTIEQPQNFVTARSRRTDMLAMMNPPAQQSPAEYTRENDLRFRIATALNSVSAENGSDTPDFILAEYLLTCLQAFDNAVNVRDRWYGRGGPMAEATEIGPGNDPGVLPGQDFPDATAEADESLARPTGRDRLA